MIHYPFTIARIFMPRISIKIFLSVSRSRTRSKKSIGTSSISSLHEVLNTWKISNRSGNCFPLIC
jgi:hypothetical protein